MRNLGGRDLDIAIAKRIAVVFKEQTGSDVRHIPKAWLRVMQAAEKAKQHLTIDNKAIIRIEALQRGNDLDYILTVQEFSQIIAESLT